PRSSSGTTSCRRSRASSRSRGAPAPWPPRCCSARRRRAGKEPLVGRADGPRLGELQRRFFELVTAPRSVAEELAARRLPPEHVEAFVSGDARASAVERLDVYANMYFFRILAVP